ncbi:hypothetical protein C0Q70_13262 [Pomacea canaliculata]|uniref:Large ribosomal subunit protein mL49 n=1 Tax=Pomacea canaliculata TaxID=400727 RepID=A0A2T7NWR0_POMCA|nr:hypothetical protein C0Q70_13262 [Pomacea canaliculata]
MQLHSSASFESTPQAQIKAGLTEFEVSADPEEFKFVERLLPYKTVPSPPSHTNYPTPSGWIPQKEADLTLPYFVRRTKNHMLPIYQELRNGNTRKLVKIRYIEGDIWALDADLREYLQQVTGSKIIATQVHEIARWIRVLLSTTLDPDDMITACDTQDFAPFGREYLRHHPGQFQVQNSKHFDHGVPLLKSFREISLHDAGKKEQWLFFGGGGKTVKSGENEEKTSKWRDEELYVSGLTVVWSKAGQDGVRSVIKTFTMDSPVLQVLWATFVLPDNDTKTDIGPAPQSKDEPQNGICVVESSSMTFFTDAGGEYSTVLPFQVSQTWPIKNGLLFQRALSPSELAAPKKNTPNQTIIFSLFHPLDDVCPVIMKTSGPGGSKLSYMTDSAQHILFTAHEPSLALIYDTVLGLHSAWRVRKARPEECSAVVVSLENTSLLHLTPLLGHNHSNSSHSRLLNSISAPSSSFSPMRNLSEKLFSPTSLLRSSPVLPHFTSSRSQSPVLTSEAALYRFHTPSPQVRSVNNLYSRTPNSSCNSSFLDNESYLEGPAAPQPEICLEHLWTEPVPPIRDGHLGKASKVFLSEDFCGQWYLCFMVPYRNQLRCVKFEESNDLSQLIFGTVTILPARDACPVESIGLIVVLETSGLITVYTGTTKISHLHIPLLPLGSHSLSLVRATTPQGSPTRGEIFTSSRPPSAVDARFDEEMTHLSPVPQQLEGTPSHLEGSIGDSVHGSSLIQSLHSNVRNKICVELLNGDLYRTTLPKMCTSPGINLSLKALKHLLPKDVALQLLGRWYTLRNTPGGIGTQAEWHVFQRCLLGLMGYDTTRLALTSKHELDRSMSPDMSAKRARPSDQGGEEKGALVLKECLVVPDHSTYSKPCTIDTSALLFQHCPAILLALHLVYEELKLNVLLHEEVESLAPLLYQIARDQHCHFYSDLYCRDFPQLFDLYDDISQISEGNKMQYPQVFPREPPCVLSWIYHSLCGTPQMPLLYIPLVCCSTVNVISLYAVLFNKEISTELAVERCLRRLAPAGITQQDLNCLPVGVSLPLREAILRCRCNPPSDWSEKEYNLIGRQDLCQLLHNHSWQPDQARVPTSHPVSGTTKDDEDGMEHMDSELLSLRWSEDLRVQEVRHMLQSAHPVRIAIVQRPEVSDHDFIEEQERHLYSICIRTMALPVGRGMFTLCTYVPLTTEALPIPKLCLTGRAPPRNTTVDLTRVEVPANMTAWPQFHNGVAAGLRIANFSQVESAWIIYNKPKSNELTNEYAGFLMALGLNGHLPNLNTLNVHDYLSKGHEMTTIGILLGLAAAKRGTMDLATTKVLSVHVPALLPPTSTELNIPHNVQVAAVLGVGLVYQGTAHSHMAEVLLAEIGRPPGPEMENCIDRESYSLAAGLALGLVMFGKGKQAIGLSNHSMADILCHLMVGGQKRPLPGIYRERFRSPSYLITEGDCVNVDVTSPGATLALGMLFFRTGNSAIAEWLQAPDTQFMLDQIRADFLLLRTLSRGLVMWDTVVPSMEWVESNIPEIIRKYSFKRGQEGEEEDESIDYETMSQAWINIVAASSMVLGLKFAGTANRAAYDTLVECVQRTMIIISTPSMCEQAGKNIMENCLSVVVTALSMVMAGTGDLFVLRLCRFLRKRVGLTYGAGFYGSHLAHAMATGLLFLGGGKYTLSTTPESVGAMLIAFFPRFPISSIIYKHFDIYMCWLHKPRILIPRDVDSGRACYVPLKIKFKDCADYQKESFEVYAPFLLPELEKIEEIKVLGPRYWPVVFHRDKNWDKIKMILQRGGGLCVKQRAGHLSYTEDPKGYRSMLAKSLTADHSSHSSTKPDVIKSFTSDPHIIALTEFFLGSKADLLAQQCAHCAHTGGMWQMKLCLAYNNSSHCLHRQCEPTTTSVNLLEQQFLLSLSRQIEDQLDSWRNAQGANLCIPHLAQAY